MRWIRHIIGLATLAGAVLGGLYLWALLETGPDESAFSITLIFDSTEGLREGARVSYRGVAVGEVRRIRLDAGGDAVRVECDLTAAAEGSVRANSRFWIVRPMFLGLAEGASGLDTLIKDSYISYDSPEQDGRPAPPLAPGSRIPGLTRAPIRNLRGAIDEEQAGDLRFSVVFEENSRLQAGARVRFRGTDVGVVEDVALSSAGDGVWVTARVDRAYRDTVRTASAFWIARPTAEANWSTGVEVHDLDALLAGAYLAYYTPAGGAPASDDHRFRGLAKRPELEWPAPSLDTGRTPLRVESGHDPLEQSLVRIFYDFREKDLWSRDDIYHFEGIGVAFTTRDGFTAVLTHRHRVEGNALVHETLSEPEIVDEVLKVRFPSGTVLNAGVAWKEPKLEDLCLLRVEFARQQAGPAIHEFMDFTFDPDARAAVEIICPTESGSFSRFAGVVEGRRVQVQGETPTDHGIVVTGGKAVGLVHRLEDGWHCVSFRELPESLRGE